MAAGAVFYRQIVWPVENPAGKSGNGSMAPKESRIQAVRLCPERCIVVDYKE
jgi:hypothetical protein